jgi:hypothetical protein
VFGRTPFLEGSFQGLESETAFKKSSRSSRSEDPKTEVKKDSRHYIIFSVDQTGFIGVSPIKRSTLHVSILRIQMRLVRRR